MNEIMSVSGLEALEQQMRQYRPLDIPVRHWFSDGVYGREIRIPAGTLLTGKIHKYQHLNILSQGDISVLMDDGIVRIQAPFTIVSPSGTKRVAYAHTDCVWTTILRTDQTEPEQIEARFVADSEAEYLEFLKERPCLSLP